MDWQGHWIQIIISHTVRRSEMVDLTNYQYCKQKNLDFLYSIARTPNFNTFRNTFYRPQKIKTSLVTINHLVAVDIDKDLLPTIRTHCYSDLVTGKQTYNLDTLQRSVEDKFVRGRPLIEEMVDTLMFREGSCNEEAFKSIRRNIPQVIMVMFNQILY